MMLIYTECRNNKEAQALAQKLIKQSLAACANWWPIRSAYKWKGKYYLHKEVALLFKTQVKLVRAASQSLLKHHPYKNPVIIAWPIKKINRSAADWLKETLGD